MILMLGILFVAIKHLVPIIKEAQNMFLHFKTLLIVTLTFLVCTIAAIGGVEDKIEGRVIGSTGEILHINVPVPVKEGTFFELRILPSEPVIAEVSVLSCTKERPFIVLAKVVKMDYNSDIPLGVKAYTDYESVLTPDAPKPIKHETPRYSDPNRFSLQFGAFYPRKPIVRDTVADYWQAARLNYSILKINSFETMLSAEYTKGTGSSSEDLTQPKVTQEIVPITALAQFQALKVGSMKLTLGAGGGLYFTRTQEFLGSSKTSNISQQLGHEFSAGLESTHGWIMELRYRDVPNTDIQGYSLTMGARF